MRDERTNQQRRAQRIHDTADARTKFITATLAGLSGTAQEKHVALDAAMCANGFGDDRLTGTECGVLGIAHGV